MTWLIITPMILEIVKRFLPKWMHDLLEKVLPKTEEKIVANAPAQLKSVVLGFILVAISKIKRPIIQAALTKVVENLGDTLFDMLWDMAFAHKLVTMMSGEFKDHTFLAEPMPMGLEAELATL